MKGIKTLVLMQLRDKMDLSYLGSAKKTIFKIVLSVVKFCLITALIYFGFYILSYLRLVSLLPGIPQKLLVVIFALMFTLSIIVCTFGLMKSLYFSKDNPLLLTMPTKRTAVFSSKLLVYYFYELMRNIYYLVPIFVAYALINKIGILFYLWLPLAVIIISVLPVVFGALFSIPLMFIANFIKNHKWLEYFLVASVIAGIVGLLVVVISAIPTNIDLIGTWGTTFWKIQAFLNDFTSKFVVFNWITVALSGTRYGTVARLFTLQQMIYMIIIIAVIVLVLLITYLLVRPLFFQMASSPFEYRKTKAHKPLKNKKHNSFVSAVYKEIVLIYRTPSKFYSLIFIAFGTPIAIFLLNKIYAAMDIRLIGSYMTIAFNVLLILLFVLSSNISLSYVFSEEGNSSYLMKTNPRPLLQSAFAKLVINMILITISIAVTVWIFAWFLGFGWVKTLIIFGMIECVFLVHMLQSAEFDIINPQTAQYQTSGVHLSNPNEIKSAVYVFVFSAAFAYLTFFFLPENRDMVWVRLLFVAGALLVYRMWQFTSKVKVYFQERE